MIVVLDASAAIEIALNKSSARLFQDTVQESDLVIAPDTYPWCNFHANPFGPELQVKQMLGGHRFRGAKE